MKETLLMEQDYLDAILEHCQDGIYITDNEANTVYLNHSYERISGLLRAEMIGKNMRTLVENGVVSASGTLSVLENGESITIEQSFRTGKRAVIISSPVYENAEDRGHIIMVVTIVREITEIYSIRRELRRVMALNREYANEIRRLEQELGGGVSVVAVDEKSVRMVRLAERVSALNTPVLISGESGVGKETLAHYIHQQSARREYSFLVIDWSVIPEDNLVGYLFGYEDAGTQEYHMGVLESADGGTIYMKDIDQMPVSVQDRMLALLHSGSCVMGEGILRRLDVRFIVSSLEPMIVLREKELVREEILQCFSAFSIELTPLRERRDDIIPLAEHFIRQYNRQTGEKKKFSRQCYQRLLEYDWPGNVQELRVLVQRAAIVSEGNLMDESDLLLADSAGGAGASSVVLSDYLMQKTGHEDGDEGMLSFSVHKQCSDLKYESARLEAYYMNLAFARYHNIRDAADSLGIDSSTFVRKRQRYKAMGLMED
ncbi:MAG: sigma 54-interacting transcriptional regulator [Clostridiales bacterium]|nr:sigma 54-interacting transcriptional regulator [Clostridiales bacterium]